MDLRPAWWVLRGLLAAWTCSLLMGANIAGVLLVLPAVALSVWLGRRRDRLVPWLAGLVVVGNGLAAVVLVVFGLNVLSGGAYTGQPYPGDAATYAPPPGELLFEGQQVANLYAYDSQGNPLNGVRLFDDQGRPVNVGEQSVVDPATGEEMPRPVTADTAGTAWRNVFPLRAPSSVTSPQGPTVVDVLPNDSGWVPPSTLPPLVLPSVGATSGATSTVSPTGKPATPTPVPTSSVTAPAPSATTTR